MRSSIHSDKEQESHPLDVMQESEPILIQGYLTLQTRGSDVFYCVTFSQSLLAAAPPKQKRKRTVPQSAGRAVKESSKGMRFTPERIACWLSSRKWGISPG